jgi:hypothetical protein
VDGEGNVQVDVIYEPPQSATAASLQLERGTEEEQRAEYLAGLLGCALMCSLNCDCQWQSCRALGTGSSWLCAVGSA